MLTVSEITKWTGITVFEILLHCVALLLTTILIVVKWYSLFTSITYWHMFSPLFVASALNCYFLFIVFVRMIIEERQFKRAFVSNSFNFLRAIMLWLFELFICYKVEGNQRNQVAVESSYGMMFMPIWILMTAFGFQACRLL
uniref:Transmembrane protein n=1 Tax=Ditylenchus dipsaci TaxID=166011 RepID=A0A915DGT0_9BILA